MLVSGIRDYDEPTDTGALGTGKCILNASVLELVYKMVLKTIARKGLRDRGPSLAPIVLSITLNCFIYLWL